MNIRFHARLLNILLLVATIALPEQQVIAYQSGNSCQMLPTQYPLLLSEFMWLDSDTVAFRVGNTLADDDLGAERLWYSYTNTNHKLLGSNTLPMVSSANSSLAAIKSNLDALGAESYWHLRMSPSNTKVIYPKRVGEITTYWLLDTNTNASYDLRLSMLGALSNSSLPDVYWYPDEKTFILQTLPNSVSPILLGNISNTDLQLKLLAENPPWAEMGLGIIDFIVAGLSLDGRYLAVKPDPVTADGQYEAKLWIYDSQLAQLQKIDIYPMGNGKIRWISNSTFVALTLPGVIEYDVSTKKSSAILKSTETDRLAAEGRTQISPNGQYIIGMIMGNEGSPTGAGVLVCQLT
ncbi:MAG: hypothetical protein KF726_03180 [Anaerolineae bacterium]|nr:hypothetical protein [Anaerolineae bacterium]